MHIRVPLATAAVLLCAWSGAAEAKRVALDAGLYATYAASPTEVDFSVCGHLQQGSGCFGGDFLQPPFEQACAVLEGTPKQKDNVIKRAIYVLDKRTSNSDPVTLYVYVRTDTITATLDTVNVKFKAKIPMSGVTGGSNSKCFMAASDTLLYAGTDASQQAGVVDKAALTVSLLSISGTLVSITSDERGYIAVDFGGGTDVFDPQGVKESVSGSRADMVSTRNAWRP